MNEASPTSEPVMLCTGLSKKVPARLRELTPIIVASSRNLAEIFLDNPVHVRPSPIPTNAGSACPPEGLRAAHRHLCRRLRLLPLARGQREPPQARLRHRQEEGGDGGGAAVAEKGVHGQEEVARQDTLPAEPIGGRHGEEGAPRQARQSQEGECSHLLKERWSHLWACNTQWHSVSLSLKSQSRLLNYLLLLCLETRAVPPQNIFLLVQSRLTFPQSSVLRRISHNIPTLPSGARHPPRARGRPRARRLGGNVKGGSTCGTKYDGTSLLSAGTDDGLSNYSNIWALFTQR